MRTYLFLSDSCGKNSVDVNERQLVLIKNLIAPQHAMQRYQNKTMINFCGYGIVAWKSCDATAARRPESRLGARLDGAPEVCGCFVYTVCT